LVLFILRPYFFNFVVLLVIILFSTFSIFFLFLRVALLRKFLFNFRLGVPTRASKSRYLSNFLHVLASLSIYCTLASCYIRLTMNICSFVHQCNTFTSYILLIVDVFRPHTAIFRRYSILSRSWCRNWHNRAPASGEYTITPEDVRVRPKHVDE
jgi:hypothetical protein